MNCHFKLKFTFLTFAFLTLGDLLAETQFTYSARRSYHNSSISSELMAHVSARAVILLIVVLAVVVAVYGDYFRYLGLLLTNGWP